MLFRSPLRELAPCIAPLVKHGGSLVLSGILAAQAEDVMDAYRAFGFVFTAPAERDGWVRLVAGKY